MFGEDTHTKKMRRDGCLWEPRGSTKVCLLTCRVTLITQLTSREHVLLLAQEHGDMEWKWGVQRHVRSSGL